MDDYVLSDKHTVVFIQITDSLMAVETAPLCACRPHGFFCGDESGHLSSFRL
jgi:hypothetical protein